MPAYNASKFIELAIRSVINQTYTNWELIIIDDGSTDNTASIVKEIQQVETRLVYHYQKNQRLGAARNAGLKLAKGQWIAFLDADDIWVNNKLEVQMGAVKTNDVGVVFTDGYYLNDNEQTETYKSLPGLYTGKKLYNILLNHNYIPVPSVCIKKNIVDKVGFFDTDPIVHGNEDWDYWLRTCKTNTNFLGIAMPLFKYRVHADGMSANRQTMLLGSYYVIAKNYDKTLLDTNEQRQQKLRLIAALTYIVKSALQLRSVKYILLAIKIVALSLSSIPVIVYNSIKKVVVLTAY